MTWQFWKYKSFSVLSVAEDARSFPTISSINSPKCMRFAEIELGPPLGMLATVYLHMFGVLLTVDQMNTEILTA